MKLLNYFILILATLSFSLAQNQEDDILKILNKTYKHKIPKYPDYQIYDPFQKAIPAIKKAEKVKIKPVSIPVEPKVKAIINNSAYIDDAWRDIGDTIRGYKLVKVNSNSVVLQFGDKNITLMVLKKHLKGDDSILIINRYKKR